MLLTSNTIFPALGLGDVTLGKNTINIKAFFSGKNTHIRNFSKKNKKLLAFSKVYFFVSVPKHGKGGKTIPAGILASPQKRIQNIAAYFHKSNLDVLNWYKYLSHKYPNNTLDMDHIFTNNKNVTKSEVTDSLSVEDINFEVDIPIDPKMYENVSMGSVSIHAFAHIDVAALIEAGEIRSIGPSISQYLTKGSNLKTKKILVKRGNSLGVPETKTALGTLDGKPYYGKYKIIAGSKPVGFTAKNKATIPLKKIQTPEKGVTAEFLLERDASPPAVTSLHQREDKLDYSYSKPILETTAIESDESVRDIYKTGVASRIKKQKTQERLRNTNNLFIANTYHCIESRNQTSNSIYFDLRWEKVVRNKTEYGYLLEHAKNKSALANILFSSTYDSTLSPETILSRVKIKQVTIKRARIKTNSAITTPAGSIKKERDLSSEVVLARIEDFEKQNNFSNENIALTVNKARTTASKKCFLLQDFELGRTPRKGEYAYTIEISVEDNVPKYLNSLLISFQSNIKKFGLFLQEIDTSKANILEKDKYKPDLISLSDPSSLIPSLIRQYLLMLCWLGKEMSQEKAIQIYNNLTTSAHQDAGGTVSGALKFKQMCDSVLHDFEKFVGKSKTIMLNNRLDVKKVTKSVSSKEIDNQKMIFNIPGTSKSIQDGKILLSYPQAFNNASIIRDAKINKGIPSMLPISYSYKSGTSTNPLLSVVEFNTNENNKNNKRKALLLDNAVKSSSDGKYVAHKIRTTEPKLDTSITFGLSGVSIGIPTSEGVFASDSGKEKPSKEAMEDLQSGLSAVLEESLTSSTRKLSGKNKLAQQEQNETKKVDIANKRTAILDKTIEMLSLIKNQDPHPRVGSNKQGKISGTEKARDKIFSKRAGIIMVGMRDNTAEMIFAPLTKQLVDKIKSKTAVVKIEQSQNKTSKEEYFVVDNIFEVPRETLRDLVKQNR